MVTAKTSLSARLRVTRGSLLHWYNSSNSWFLFLFAARSRAKSFVAEFLGNPDEIQPQRTQRAQRKRYLSEFGACLLLPSTVAPGSRRSWLAAVAVDGPDIMVCARRPFVVSHSPSLQPQSAGISRRFGAPE